MNILKAYALIAIFAAVTLSTSSALAQGSYTEEACPNCGGQDIYVKEQLSLQNIAPILVWTDQDVYDHESIVMVEGVVKTVKANTPVTILVVGPTNNVVTIDQVMIGSDGKFQAALNTASDLWKFDGTYTIRAQYGHANVFDKVTIELTGGIVSGISIPTFCTESEISARSPLGLHCIPYEVTGADVISGTIDVGETSLIIGVNAFDDGSITLDIPRSILDAKINGGGDDDFFVLVDGEETNVDFDEGSSNSRTITIPFLAGAEEIEIIGTYAVPEFGTIAAMILAVAIISIIAVSAKTKLRIMPNSR